MKLAVAIVMRSWIRVMPSASGLVLTIIIRMLEIYNILIFVRVIASWIVQDPTHPIMRFLYGITEPILGPIRNLMPNIGLDFSPIVAYLLISVITQILRSIL